MSKKVTLSNVQIPTSVWFYSMSRDKLRKIAKKNKVMRGRYKKDIAYNLSRGISEDGKLYSRIFEVKLS